jgi:hypothetical protein
MAEIPAASASTDRFQKAPQPQVGPFREVHLLGEGSPGLSQCLHYRVCLWSRWNCPLYLPG